MWAIRSPKPNTRLSCVTTTTARSGRTAASRNSSMTVMPVSWSSAAVGSSQTRSRGSCTRARAIATRCIWPPESWLGRLSASCPSRSPTRPRRPCLTARCFVQPAITRGIAAFSAAVERGQKVVLLKHESNVLGAKPGQRPVAHGRQSRAEYTDCPAIAVEDAGDDRQQASSCRSPTGRRSGSSGRCKHPSQLRAGP